MATAAATTIVQVTEVVAIGAIDPETVVTPGLYVDTVVTIPAAPTAKESAR
jgi:3-oxoadipate CoA-transferase alpha subunit